MTVSNKAWQQYIKTLSAIDQTAARKFEAFVSGLDIAKYSNRKKAIDYAVRLASVYGESAAAAACEMYDAIVAAAGMYYPLAEPAVLQENIYGEVAKTVNGMIKQQASPESMGKAIGRLVKRTAADTTLKNAIRDHAEFAWIPSGDSCAFCIMLASNGWQPASKAALNGGHAEHIHANCDCEYAIRFTPDTEYAGYNPREYRDMYDEADEDGKSWEARVNVMRRQQYAEKKDEINAQKREAYAERKERLGETEQNG